MTIYLKPVLFFLARWAAKVITKKYENTPLSNRDRREYAAQELMERYPNLTEKEAYFFIHDALL
jgi:hypothetical protein